MADAAITIEPMSAADWPAVRRIYAEGIATGDATLERDPPDWDHFDRSHPTGFRLVARSAPDGVIGWTALAGYSTRRVYAGVAWESVYVAESAQQHATAPRRSSSPPARDDQDFDVAAGTSRSALSQMKSSLL